MSPSSFQFFVTLPCDATYRDLMRELVRCALQYAGYPKSEIDAMLGAIDGAALATMPAEAAGGTAVLALTTADDTLAIEVSGPHLPPDAPAAGSMTVTAGRRDGRPALKFVQRLPVA